METPTYQQRMARVLRHIEQHLDSRPDLEELARIAGFSRFHFHRIFTSMAGESVAAYVRRLLLERAAMRLGHSHEPITRIALDAGYESLDAFSRAFRARFFCCPPNTAVGAGTWNRRARVRRSAPSFTMSCRDDRPWLWK